MSAIRSNAGEGETPPQTSAIDNTYKFLSSVRFAILLLSFIAASCVVGTLVKQQAPPQEYLGLYSESTYAILKFLGFTDVFHAPWFLFLGSLFVLNLVLCTVDKLTHFLKSGRVAKLPNEKTLAAMPLSFLIRGGRTDQLTGFFKGYRRTTHNESGQVLEKGGLSRYGVYMIHASIIIILIGSFVGLLFGYRGFVTIRKGEVKDAIMKRGAREAAAIPLGFGIKCEDFNVSFYPSGEPKDYVSRVQIIDNGKSVRNADVRVNHPLSYKGTNIYQASYGSDQSFLFNVGGEDVKLAQGSVFKKDKLTIMLVRFERSVHNFGPGVQVAYLEGSEPKTTWFLTNVPQFRNKEIMGVPVALTGISDEFYTGLEVSRDPGVWIVWTGFALILFGLYVNFFMYHRRIYLLQTPEGVLVAGAAPRNKEAFEEEFGKWRKKANDL